GLTRPAQGDGVAASASFHDGAGVADDAAGTLVEGVGHHACVQWLACCQGHAGLLAAGLAAREEAAPWGARRRTGITRGAAGRPDSGRAGGCFCGAAEGSTAVAPAMVTMATSVR